MLTQKRLKQVFHYDDSNGDFTWRVSSGRVASGDLAGYKMQSGYIQINLDGKKYYAHRLIWLYVHGEWPDEIDHIDHNKTNNRIANLRNVTKSGNMQNQICANLDSKTQLIGSWLHPCGKYVAQITFLGKKKHLGLFATAEEAHQAYVSAKRIYHTTCTI